MNELVIETRGLNKTFHTRAGAVRVAVRDLDLAVPALLSGMVVIVLAVGAVVS